MTSRPEETMTDEERAREHFEAVMNLSDIGRLTDEALMAAAQSFAAAVRADERRRIVDVIRGHATDVTLFAKGRALDLMAWILALPEAP